MADLLNALRLARKNADLPILGGNGGYSGNTESKPLEISDLHGGGTVATGVNEVATVATEPLSVATVANEETAVATRCVAEKSEPDQRLGYSVANVATVSTKIAVFGECSDPTSWRSAFAALTPAVLPCPGFRNSEWPRVHRAALAFLDDQAEAAHALGWDAISLFGVHPVVGATRVDCCGALMVSSGQPIMMVERDVVAFCRTRFFRQALIPDAVLVWEFGR